MCFCGRYLGSSPLCYPWVVVTTGQDPPVCEYQSLYPPSRLLSVRPHSTHPRHECTSDVSGSGVPDIFPPPVSGPVPTAVSASTSGTSTVTGPGGPGATSGGPEPPAPTTSPVVTGRVCAIPSDTDT